MNKKADSGGEGSSGWRATVSGNGWCWWLLVLCVETAPRKINNTQRILKVNICERVPYLLVALHKMLANFGLLLVGSWRSLMQWTFFECKIGFIGTGIIVTIVGIVDRMKGKMFHRCHVNVVVQTRLMDRSDIPLHCNSVFSIYS